MVHIFLLLTMLVLPVLPAALQPCNVHVKYCGSRAEVSISALDLPFFLARSGKVIPGFHTQIGCLGYNMHLQASPNWLTTLVLSALLAALTWKLAVRAGITWQRESEALAAAHAAAGAPDLARPLLAEEAGERVPVAESFEAETYDPPTPMRANGAWPILVVVQQAPMCDGLHHRCSSAVSANRWSNAVHAQMRASTQPRMAAAPPAATAPAVQLQSRTQSWRNRLRQVGAQIVLY